MTDVRREMFEYARAQAKARAERKKERAKLKGLDTVSSKRRRTEKMNRELAAKKRELWDRDTKYGHVPPFLPACGLCNEYIHRLSDCDPDHDNGRGAGGGHRNDDEIHLVHKLGNIAKGSIRLARYLKLPLAIRRKNCGISG